MIATSPNSFNKDKAIVIALIVATILAVILSSCYTPSKADKQLSKALNKYPNKVATIARNNFPCVTVKKDTTIAINYVDTTIEVNCDTVIESVAVPGKEVIKIVTKTITIPAKIITITQKVEDSAKIFLLNQQLKDSSNLADRLRAAIIEKDNKIANKNWWLKRLGISLILLILLIAGYIFLIIRKASKL